MRKVDQLEKYTETKRLETSSKKNKLDPQKSEIDIRINKIKNSLREYQAIKAEIVEDLIFLRNHQEKLKQEKGITFKELLEDLTGYSKSYFYQLTGNYQFLLEHNRIDLFEKVDTVIIEKIRQINDKKKQNKFLKNAETLTRKDFQKERQPVRPSDSDNIIDVDYSVNDVESNLDTGRPTPAEIAIYLLKDFKQKEKKSKVYEETFALESMQHGVIAMVKEMYRADLISDNEIKKIKKQAKVEIPDLNA